MTDWVRVECDKAGYESNWIETARKWTRAQSRLLLSQMDEDAFWELFRTKAKACNIEFYDDDDQVIETITDPADITDDKLDGMDGVLVEFIGEAMVMAFAKARGLDFTNGPASSDTSETEM